MVSFLPFARFAALSLAAGVLAASCTGTPSAAPSPISVASPVTGDGRTPAGGEGARRTVTLVGAGDVLVHPQVWQQASRDGGFAAIFDGVRPAVSGADLAICHLETPLAGAAGPFAGFPRFSTPPQVLAGIKAAGFDACSTASNHSYDQGERGVVRTIAAFDAIGLGHVGTYARPDSAGRASFYEASGVRVAHLSATFGFNGIPAPGGKQWLANRIDPARILAEAHRARQAGAQLVIVSLHWGTEYRHEPDPAQRSWAQRLAGSPDIDLILGHHAHVVQPIRRIKGTWVVFGMGNELARHAEPLDANREGLMVRATFAQAPGGRWTVSRIEPLPTWVELAPAIRIVDLTAALAQPSLDATRRRVYQAAYDRVLDHVSRR